VSLAYLWALHMSVSILCPLLYRKYNVSFISTDPESMIILSEKIRMVYCCPEFHLQYTFQNYIIFMVQRNGKEYLFCNIRK
jgi:hypothetical protein